MSLPPELLRVSRGAAVRLTLQRAVRHGAQASSLVLAIGVAMFLSALVVPVGVPMWWTLLGALGAGGVVAVAAAALRPVGIRASSQLVDRRLSLHERTSTAIELALAPSEVSPLAPRVIADAERHLHDVSLARVFPLRPPREAWVAVALALLVVASNAWLRGLSFPGTPARQSADVIREEGARLAAVAQALQARARTERSAQTNRLAAQMQTLGRRLQRERTDRAGALARISELSRQSERAHREVRDRMEATMPAPRNEGSAMPNLMRRHALARQIRQLRELSSRLQEDRTADDRQQSINRLTAMLEGEQGPAQIRSQLEQARKQLQQGNVGQAGEAMSEALRNLEGLQALIADEEGLRTVQQQLQRSMMGITSGTAGAIPPESTASQPEPPAAGSGSSAQSPDTSTETAAPPPPGPNQGVAPGTGSVGEKLGPPSARLQAPKSPQRLRGAQGEGEVSAAEVLGAARPGSSRVAAKAISPAVVPQADRYMERAAIPARYRLLVRRYFERLVQLR